MPDKTSTEPRRWWYRVHRAQRIMRREFNKAAGDMLTFGTGCILVEGSPVRAGLWECSWRHVPIHEVVELYPRESV